MSKKWKRKKNRGACTSIETASCASTLSLPFNQSRNGYKGCKCNQITEKCLIAKNNNAYNSRNYHWFKYLLCSNKIKCFRLFDVHSVHLHWWVFMGVNALGFSTFSPLQVRFYMPLPVKTTHKTPSSINQKSFSSCMRASARALIKIHSTPKVNKWILSAQTHINIHTQKTAGKQFLGCRHKCQF